MRPSSDKQPSRLPPHTIILPHDSSRTLLRHLIAECNDKSCKGAAQLAIIRILNKIPYHIKHHENPKLRRKNDDRHARCDAKRAKRYTIRSGQNIAPYRALTILLKTRTDSAELHATSVIKPTGNQYKLWVTYSHAKDSPSAPSAAAPVSSPRP